MQVESSIQQRGSGHFWLQRLRPDPSLISATLGLLREYRIIDAGSVEAPQRTRAINISRKHRERTTFFLCLLATNPSDSRIIIRPNWKWARSCGMYRVKSCEGSANARIRPRFRQNPRRVCGTLSLRTSESSRFSPDRSRSVSLDELLTLILHALKMLSIHIFISRISCLRDDRLGLK